MSTRDWRQVHCVQPQGKKEEYYADPADAQVAAKGAGEWGSDLSVHPCSALFTAGAVFLLGAEIRVRDASSPQERERVLSCLTPYERKVLGL